MTKQTEEIIKKLDVEKEPGGREQWKELLNWLGWSLYSMDMCVDSGDGIGEYIIDRKFIKNFKTILALIDRVPSKEEAKEAWDVLQRGLRRCESVNEKACARCSKFKGCQEGEETIRKALGVEEE